VKGLVEVVMQEEIEARLADKKALFLRDTEWSALVMQHVISSTGRILIESILFGNLTKDRRANPKLETVLVALKNQSEMQPGIYYQSLVDGNGESPTANQLAVVCDHILAYLKGSRQPDAQHIVATVDDALANKALGISVPKKKTTERYSPSHHREPFYFVKVLRRRLAMVALRDRGQAAAVPPCGDRVLEAMCRPTEAP
jgi:hypothetical protein